MIMARDKMVERKIKFGTSSVPRIGEELSVASRKTTREKDD